MIKTVNYFFQSILIFTFFLMGRILGLNLSRIIFAQLFALVGPFFRSKKIIKNNLHIAFNGISKINENVIAKNMWKNYGMTFIEYIFLNYFRKKNSHRDINDNANLSKIITENKPVIFVSGHFANFELMSMEITKKNIQLATIYRPLNNFFFKSVYGIFKKKIYL